jgi:hypothetical protein
MAIELQVDGTPQAKTVVNVKPNDWFPVELIADGNNVRVAFASGSLALEGVRSKLSAGPIVLRLPQANSTVELRNIAIKELPSGATAAAPKATAGAPGATAGSPSSAAIPDKDWTKLFNGKDLTGWKTHPNQPGFWKVENGELVGFGATSHLFSERGDFEDFHLRVEAQINDGGSGGVYFRVPEFALARYGQFPDGYEANINSTAAMDKAKTGSLTGSLRGVAPYNVAVHKPDEWFTMEVLAHGPQIVIKVNGQTTVDFLDANNSFRRGHLALQVWPAESVIRFRKIEIKELSPTAPGKSVPEQLYLPRNESRRRSGGRNLRRPSKCVICHLSLVICLTSDK